MKRGLFGAWRWVVQERHQAALRRAWECFVRAFTWHPQETGETYLVHLWFTVKTSLMLLMLSLVILIHGIFPFWFLRTTSNRIEKLYQVMQARAPKTPGHADG